MTAGTEYQLERIAVLLERQLGVNGARPSWHYAPPAGGIVDTTAVTIAPNPGPTRRNFLRSVQVINQAAAVETEVVVRDGSAGPVLHRISTKETGGGYTAIFDPPLASSAGNLLEVVALTTASETYFNAQGWIE